MLSYFFMNFDHIVYMLRVFLKLITVIHPKQNPKFIQHKARMKRVTYTQLSSTFSDNIPFPLPSAFSVSSHPQKKKPLPSSVTIQKEKETRISKNWKYERRFSSPTQKLRPRINSPLSIYRRVFRAPVGIIFLFRNKKKWGIFRNVCDRTEYFEGCK